MATPPRIFCPPSRTTTPLRTNKKSLPDQIQAYLTFDLTWYPNSSLYWRDEYNDFDEGKIRNRWQTIKSIKKEGGKKWNKLLSSAKECLKHEGMCISQ